MDDHVIVLIQNRYSASIEQIWGASLADQIEGQYPFNMYSSGQVALSEAVGDFFLTCQVTSRLFLLEL